MKTTRNHHPVRKNGFTLVEITMLLILAMLISLMGLQLIQQQGWIQKKVSDLDNIERTGLAMNTLCTGMASNWQADVVTRSGVQNLIFENRNEGNPRVVAIERVAVVRRGVTYQKMVGKVYATRAAFVANTPLSPTAFDITDSIITSIAYSKDISSIRVILTDRSGAAVTSYAAINPY